MLARDPTRPSANRRPVDPGPFLATPGWGPERLARSCSACAGSGDFRDSASLDGCACSSGCDGRCCIRSLEGTAAPLAASPPGARRLPSHRRRRDVPPEPAARGQPLRAAMEATRFGTGIEKLVSATAAPAPLTWLACARAVSVTTERIGESSLLLSRWCFARPGSPPPKRVGGSRRRVAPLRTRLVAPACAGTSHSPPRGLAPSTSPSATQTVARCCVARFFHGFSSPPRPDACHRACASRRRPHPAALCALPIPEGVDRSPRPRLSGGLRCLLALTEVSAEGRQPSWGFVRQRARLDRLPREPVRLFSVVQPVVPNVDMDQCRTRANMGGTEEGCFWLYRTGK
jgi:hypothetical protein